MDFRLIDGCPCPASIAPYVYLVLREANQTASSIYRGADAEPLLNSHGKHSQRQLYSATPAQRAAWGISGQPNRPGSSQHELCSDGRIKRGPVGRRLSEWEIGVDSGTDTPNARDRIQRAGLKYGWPIVHPYFSGAELHHWSFPSRPTARGAVMRARIIALRARLPKR